MKSLLALYTFANPIIRLAGTDKVLAQPFGYLMIPSCKSDQLGKTATIQAVYFQTDEVLNLTPAQRYFEK